MFWMFFGVVIIILCRYNFKNPDSDWVRWGKRLPDDYEQDDHDLLKTQVGAAIGGFFGGVLILMGLSTLVQGGNAMSWGTLFLFAMILIGIGILARKHPTFGWRMNEGWKVKGDSEPSDPYIDLVKFGGLISICLGSIFFVLGMMTLLL